MSCNYIGDCGNCYYFELLENTSGYCHRYPTLIKKEIESYCGEFVSKEGMYVRQIAVIKGHANIGDDW